VDVLAIAVHRRRKAARSGAVADPADWQDAKRALWPFALIVPLLPFLAGLAVKITGIGLLWGLGPLVVFGLMPALDRLGGLDTDNPPAEAEDRLDADRYYRWCTWAYVPLQYLGLVWATRLWAQGDLSTIESLGLATTVGCVAGLGINIAHELGHKRPAVERWLSKVGLAQSAYGHFQLEHNRGHHAKVSTPEDPASSRLGENFYEFLPRTVVGSLRSAIRLERERTARLGLRFWSPGNELLNAWAMSVVLFGGLLVAFGWRVAPWLAVQAVFGFCMLEVVNYIEHYGLLRGRRPDGRYERCRPEHSWNASNAASNLLLFQLQRHSDHHAFPTRRYQVLRHFDEVPQLPTGYAGMIVLAVCPPLWRRVMDPRVVAFYDGDVERANLHPRTRARILARHGAAPAGTASAA
jgi:alkane 1-monooxygenase